MQANISNSSSNARKIYPLSLRNNLPPAPPKYNKKPEYYAIPKFMREYCRDKPPKTEPENYIQKLARLQAKRITSAKTTKVTRSITPSSVRTSFERNFNYEVPKLRYKDYKNLVPDAKERAKSASRVRSVSAGRPRLPASR